MNGWREAEKPYVQYARTHSLPSLDHSIVSYILLLYKCCYFYLIQKCEFDWKCCEFFSSNFNNNNHVCRFHFISHEDIHIYSQRIFTTFNSIQNIQNNVYASCFELNKLQAQAYTLICMECCGMLWKCAVNECGSFYFVFFSTFISLE